MKIQTTKGIYDIRFDWDKAEIVRTRKDISVELSYCFNHIASIEVSSELEATEVLNKLNEG